VKKRPQSLIRLLEAINTIFAAVSEAVVLLESFHNFASSSSINYTPRLKARRNLSVSIPPSIAKYRNMHILVSTPEFG
jgi:hypothetical protein